MNIRDTNRKINIKDLVQISIFAIILSICSYISIPFIVPITLQTFGIFITCLLLGGKKGTITIALWILLGIIGLPVFQGFKSGLAAIVGPTGGYIIGFIFSSMNMCIFEKCYKNNLIYKFLIMIMSLIICYIFGTIWFVKIYTNTNGDMTVFKALSICVFPFILFDILKIILAIIISQNKYLKQLNS